MLQKELHLPDAIKLEKSSFVSIDMIVDKVRRKDIIIAKTRASKLSKQFLVGLAIKACNHATRTLKDVPQIQINCIKQKTIIRSNYQLDRLGLTIGEHNLTQLCRSAIVQTFAHIINHQAAGSLQC